MILTAVLVNYLSYDTYHKAEAGIRAIEGIPEKIGEWQGKDMSLKNRVYDLLETKSIIHRVYVSHGLEVFLSIVYHPDTKVGFHTPDFCLAANGIEFKRTIKSIYLNNDEKNREIELCQLIYKINSRKELSYYFFKSGEFLGQNYLKFRLNLAINKFSNKKKSGSLIRVSTTIPDGNTHKASNILRNFIEGLHPFLIKYL